MLRELCYWLIGIASYSIIAIIVAAFFFKTYLKYGYEFVGALSRDDQISWAIAVGIFWPIGLWFVNGFILLARIDRRHKTVQQELRERNKFLEEAYKELSDG